MTEVKIETYKIELLPLDAELFKTFRQYQDRFLALYREGVLDLRSGQATLHFDSSGALRIVEVKRNI